MKRLGVGLVAALVLGSLVLLLRARSEREPGTPVEGTERAEHEDRTEAPVLRGASVLEEEPRSALQPAEARPGGDEKRSQGELVITVVDDSAAPVGRAEVFLIDWGGVVRSPELDRRAGIDALLEHYALRRVGDAEGKARFPSPLGAGLAAARLGERFASAVLARAEAGPVVLTLVSDPPVRVRVTDMGGTPAAGVQVSLCSARTGRDLVRAPTGRDGIARLYAREHRSDLARDGARVALAVPLLEQVEAPVDLALVPEEPVELRLPDVGRIEVELVDEHDAGPHEPLRVSLELSTRMQAELGERGQRFRKLECWTRSAHVSFWPVGLGLELRVAADGPERDGCSLVAEGPRARGEAIDVWLELEPRQPIVTGRIVDTEGRAFGPGTLSVLARAGQGSSGRSCSVDADGRFRFAVDDPEEVDALELALTAPPGSEAWGEVVGPRLGRGESELGDVVLAPAPLFVSGTVRDEGGAPVPSARLLISYSRVPQGSGGFELWSDGQGRFESHAREAGVATFSAFVQAPDFQVQRLEELRVGSTDLEIVLVRGGWILGRIEQKSGMMPTLQLLRGGASVLATLSISPQGFQLGPVPGGRYALACGYPWSEQKLVIEGIEVVVGERTRDTRLDPLDLRALLPVLNLTVVDANGAPVREVEVALRSAVGELQNLYARRAGDAWSVVAGPLPLALHVEAPGFRPMEVEADSDRRLVLARGIPLRLEIAGALPLLAEGWSFAARLRRPGPPPLAAPAPEVDLLDGVAEVCVSEPGPYRCEFALVQRHAGQELDRLPWWEQGFEVADREAVQVIQLPPPTPELVAEMLAYIEANR